MDELKKRKVVEHNDLITSIAKMDKTPLKIFELAVSCIDTDNPPKDNIIYLSKTELFAFFEVSDNDKHSRFKQAIEKMQKQAFFEILITDRADWSGGKENGRPDPKRRRQFAGFSTN